MWRLLLWRVRVQREELLLRREKDVYIAWFVGVLL